ncbi:MAG: hypothetical protein WC718_18620 [Phycisphaerales bacterium]|jgi:hypothetical protein
MPKPTTVERPCSECGTIRHWRGFACEGCGKRAEVPTEYDRAELAPIPAGWARLIIQPSDAEWNADYSRIFCSQGCALAHPDKWSA